MATHKSAIKRSRQSEKRRSRNASVRSGVKSSIKSVLKAVEEKDKEGSMAALAIAIPAIDKAAAQGAFHKKTAARKISRLAKKVNTLR